MTKHTADFPVEIHVGREIVPGVFVEVGYTLPGEVDEVGDPVVILDTLKLYRKLADKKTGDLVYTDLACPAWLEKTIRDNVDTLECARLGAEELATWGN